MVSQILTQPKNLLFPKIDSEITESAKTTQCLRCGRKLTALASVAAGIGPVCARNIAYETRRKRESPGYIYTSRTFAYLKRKDRIANSFSSKPIVFDDLGINTKRSQPSPLAGNGAISSVTYCSCCERHGVQSQVKSEISSQVGRTISVCIDCQQADCELTSDHCLFEQFNRTSPIPELL